MNVPVVQCPENAEENENHHNKSENENLTLSEKNKVVNRLTQQSTQENLQILTDRRDKEYWKHRLLFS
uniref:Uncharacterized protein n=1 Tax=Romanomermis culicivorax TaxID=13658 RepID=A0A915KCW3_ROMCU